MKKMFAVLLAMLMLFSFACAEEEAVFTFRNGLHWGMTMDEVAAAEGKTYNWVEQISYTLTSAELIDVSISKFEADMEAIFMNNQLVAVGMDPSWYTFSEYDMQDVEYLRQALCLVYGDVDETLPIPEMVSKLLMTGENCKVLYGWQPTADTYIVLADMDESVWLQYYNVNVDLVAEMQAVAPTPTPEPIITNGL